MPNNSKAIKQAYDDGIDEVYKIVGSLKSTATQIRVARQTARDLTTMLLAHTLEDVENRTALLSGLIVELNTVIDSIQTKSPYAGALKRFTGLLTRAQSLFDQEKKDLL
jgi:hypothetical protein